MNKSASGLIAVLLVSTLGSAVADDGRTIDASGLSGSWLPRGDLDDVETEIDEMKPTEIALEVSPGNQALMMRRHPGGAVEKAKSTNFRQVGSLFYWNFERDDGLEYQLILGGWNLESGTSILFGHLYLENSTYGLFNGWPVAVQRGGQLTNKGTGRDNAAPVL